MDIANMLGGAVVDGAQADIEALVRAVAFNWLILGTDAHAKNYSLLLSGPQVRLAPLYDVASAAPYEDHPKRLRMAQKVGGEYRPAQIAASHWARLATEVGVDADWLHDDMAAMASKLPDALSAAITEAGLRGGEADSARVLLDSVSAWLSRGTQALAV